MRELFIVYVVGEIYITIFNLTLLVSSMYLVLKFNFKKKMSPNLALIFFK